MPGAEERVAVGHPLVGAAPDPQHRLPAPDVREREREPVDLDPVAALDQPPSFLGILVGIGPPGQPPAFLPQLGRAQGREGEDVLGAHLLPAAERLEDRPPWKLVRPVAQQRPVRDLARGRPAGPDRVQHAARAGRRQPVEIRGDRRFVPGPPAEHLVSPVPDPVEEEDDDGKHAAQANPRRVPR